MVARPLFLALVLFLGAAPVPAQKFVLPTPNRSIFKLNEQEQYFVDRKSVV